MLLFFSARPISMFVVSFAVCFCCVCCVFPACVWYQHFMMFVFVFFSLASMIHSIMTSACLVLILLSVVTAFAISFAPFPL